MYSFIRSSGCGAVFRQRLHHDLIHLAETDKVGCIFAADQCLQSTHRIVGSDAFLRGFVAVNMQHKLRKIGIEGGKGIGDLGPLV